MPPRRRLPLLHIGLFLATVATTVIAGALQQGVDPLAHPGDLYRGIPFSFTLMLILFTHEMGHYLVSRRHRLDVTLPLFIPAPPAIYIPFIGLVPIFIIGTFGAFIRIKTPIQDKRALLDVGCAGPLTGVAVTIPILLLGLSLSPIQVIPPGTETEMAFKLGEPLLFKVLNFLIFGSLPDNYQILMHPIAFAGWIGLFVTALNLIPVGQLDGGHVAYALFGRYHRQISLACFLFLFICGLAAWPGWLVWAGLLYFLGLRHPPPSSDWIPLDRKRKILGALTIAVFILTFTPWPFSG